MSKSDPQLSLNRSLIEKELFTNYDRDHTTERTQKDNTQTHTLPMKGTLYLDMIKSGEKKYEGRVNAPFTQKIHVGDQLKLWNAPAKRGIICRVVKRYNYKSFEDMLKDRGVLLMLPQLKGKSRTLTPQALLEAGVHIYEAFPGSDRVRTSGCVAIEVEYLRDV